MYVSREVCEFVSGLGVIFTFHDVVGVITVSTAVRPFLAMGK